MNTRLRADERREEIIAAAQSAFAVNGYAGTPADEIARRAGVSQPYLFRLFGTKKEIFLAAVRSGFERTRRHFEAVGTTAVSAGLEPDRVLEEMGHGYIRLLMADRDLLRLQLHAYAACADPEIQSVVRESYDDLWRTVARVSGAPAEAVRKWFADGMLINVIASISDVRSLDDYLAAIGGHDKKD